MKLGLESRIKSIAASTFLSCAFLLLGRSLPVQLFSSTTSNELLSGETSKIKGENDLGSLDPTLQLAGLKLAESTVYTGVGRNIFRIDADPVTDKSRPAHLSDHPRRPFHP